MGVWKWKAARGFGKAAHTSRQGQKLTQLPIAARKELPNRSADRIIRITLSNSGTLGGGEVLNNGYPQEVEEEEEKREK